jgi:hypothetical protein
MATPDRPQTTSGLPAHEAAIASDIVSEVLGEGFDIEYNFARSVGQKGDARTFQETAVVTSDSDSPAKAFAERYGNVQDVVSAVTNRTQTGRIVIDVTPTEAEPRFLVEGRAEPALSFEERVLRRIEGYVIIKRKYGDELVNNPGLQQVAWEEMNARDHEIMVSMNKRETPKP